MAPQPRRLAPRNRSLAVSYFVPPPCEPPGFCVRQHMIPLVAAATENVAKM